MLDFIRSIFEPNRAHDDAGGYSLEYLETTSSPQWPSQPSQARAIVVGIGGCGKNAVQYLHDKLPPAIGLFWLVQEPGQPLSAWRQDTNASSPQLLGHGESVFRQIMSGIETLYLICGLGGSVGSDFSLKLVRLASALSIKTHALVTMPFAFEGTRVTAARKALDQLTEETTTCMVFHNDELRAMLSGQATLEYAFTLHKLWLTHTLLCLQQISEVGLLDGLGQGNRLCMGFGRSDDPNQIERTIEVALKCPLLPHGVLHQANRAFLLLGTATTLPSAAVTQAGISAKAQLASIPVINVQAQRDSRMNGDLYVTCLLIYGAPP
ncbi:MAG: hypothetical protein IPG66_01645 [Hydrogenophilales bacterium]|nr:hypothetical protein [Hydrogenophilales bacterium]